MNFLDTPEKRDRRLVHLPMGRFGEAVEIAKAALFCEWRFLLQVYRTPTHFDIVASDESSYMTVSFLPLPRASYSKMANFYHNYRALISKLTVV
jgi:hypothetical protein